MVRDFKRLSASYDLIVTRAQQKGGPRAALTMSIQERSERVLELLLGVAETLLDFAGDLVGLAFVLGLLVAGRLADGFLDGALGLLR